ncbi:uncharacterized protein BDR25DRAFT_366642 [Lindgomyces ingoldianus]|uniref:Uncharacterized protein n=1 Tax=Lindgomyces ingoldianus TaxID=673940 RepID=A0ACB6QY39_9PLEO|nr:uncharacterized protein BDR25DRAFT_366642 [Lindgomyces ingoldianus]KAF2471913.1 hypothetical protein BDR25DRAFT_366642 [Lindgomyces ingoldianus]
MARRRLTRAPCDSRGSDWDLIRQEANLAPASSRSLREGFVHRHRVALLQKFHSHWGSEAMCVANWPRKLRRRARTTSAHERSTSSRRSSSSDACERHSDNCSPRRDLGEDLLLSLSVNTRSRSPQSKQEVQNRNQSSHLGVSWPCNRAISPPIVPPIVPLAAIAVPNSLGSCRSK